MFWIFKIFSPKNLAKKLEFLTPNKAKFCKKIDHNIVISEKRQFCAEIMGKSQKIVIITSTPGLDERYFQVCRRRVDRSIFLRKPDESRRLHMYVEMMAG
jgi:hypothetical protein